MIIFIAIIALLFFAVAIAGILSFGLLTVKWGPAAAAAFATFVTLHQALADGWTILGLTLLVFIVVRLVTGHLIRSGLRVVGRLTHAL